MARDAKDSDFHVDVPGVGTFLFARRSVGDVFRIRGAYAQLTGGNYSDDGRMADVSALGYATIQTLVVDAPKSFDLDALDPLVDDDFDALILKVFSALRTKELSFRPKPAKGSEGPGPRDGEQLSALVPSEIQPGAD